MTVRCLAALAMLAVVVPGTACAGQAAAPTPGRTPATAAAPAATPTPRPAGESQQGAARPGPTPAATPASAPPPPSPAIPIRGAVVHGGLTPDVVRELKDAGVNWIELLLWVVITDEGELIPCRHGYHGPPLTPGYTPEEAARLRAGAPEAEAELVRQIGDAHRNGFKVFLVTYHERMGAHHEYGVGLKADAQSILAQAKEIALRWARIAEENGVEMFAPRKELQLFVGDDLAAEWDDDILPELRKIYRGDLVRGAFQVYHWGSYLGEGGKFVVPAEKLPASMGGWDYLGLDLYGNDTATFEDWSAYVKRYALKVRQLVDEHGLKGAVFEELGHPHRGTESFWNDESLSEEEVLESLYRRTFDNAGGAIDGFFAWDFQRPNRVFRDYFTGTKVPEADSVPPASEMPLPVMPAYTTATLISESFEDDDFPGLSVPDYAAVDGAVRLRNGTASTHMPVSDAVVRTRLNILSGTVSLFFRSSPSGRYEVSIAPLPVIQLSKQVETKGSLVHAGEMRVNSFVEFDRWYELEIVAVGGAIEVFLDGQKIIAYADPAPLPEGSFFIHAYDEALIDDLVVEAVEVK